MWRQACWTYRGKAGRVGVLVDVALQNADWAAATQLAHLLSSRACCAGPRLAALFCETSRKIETQAHLEWVSQETNVQLHFYCSHLTSKFTGRFTSFQKADVRAVCYGSFDCLGKLRSHLSC